MRIVCKKCGCPYDNSAPCCPECGAPVPTFINTTGMTNCVNCGAPITNNIYCEYCGSKFSHAQGDKIPELNQSRIGDNIASIIDGVVNKINK